MITYNLDEIEFHNNELRKIIKDLPPVSLENGPWIAGGSARKVFTGESMGESDIDLFFWSKGQLDYYKEQLEFKLLGKTPYHPGDEADKFFKPLEPATPEQCSGTRKSVADIQNEISCHPKPTSMENEANKWDDIITTGRATTFTHNGVKIQLIHRKFYDSYQDMLDDFDFTICKIVTDGDKVIMPQITLDDISERLLRLDQCWNVTNSLHRLAKYSLQGFTPLPGTVEEIISHPEQKFASWEEY